jgi:hypothetical protein
MNLILQSANSIFEELNMKKISLELIGRPASVICSQLIFLSITWFSGSLFEF